MRLIDADKAIEQIDDIFSVANDTGWLPLGLTKALVRAMLENENVTPTVGGWVSVKDRLPAKNANVLWWCELHERHMGHVRIGFYQGITNHDIPDVSCCGPNCVPMYWRPLPEPPEEVSEE